MQYKWQGPLSSLGLPGIKVIGASFEVFGMIRGRCSRTFVVLACSSLIVSTGCMSCFGDLRE
jgi:hypothetical protein